MLKFVLLAVFTVVTVSCDSFENFSNRPIVEVAGGQLQGEILSSGIFGRYNSFKGIPYAEPPVGLLRFRAPVQHRGWIGLRDASNHGHNCPSGSFLNSNTNEDCLFLNVYSPNLNGNRSVMVWIHGGSFSGGSGDAWVYGPDHLIGEDVIVVTINYRLGALGFLSTEDANAPGNYGMKDAILALRWIQNNIHSFGGNPNDVTIFGESAGGAAVHFLVLSPAAKGLFNKAISQSGSALNPWAYQTNPRDAALQLARDLKITTTTNEELVRALRNAKVEDIVKANPSSMSYPLIRGLHPVPFVPSRDPPNTIASEIFLPDEPINIIINGSFNQVPYISGYTDAESLVMIRELIMDPTVFFQINRNPELLIPPSWKIRSNSLAAKEIVTEIRNFYFNGKALSNDLRLEWTQYLTDQMFAYGIDRTVRLHSERQANPVYYYMFSFVGSLNLIKTMALLSSYPGAVHADDIFYLFSVTRFPPPLLPTNTAIMTRRRMVRMWTNFAKTGNPTPTTDSLVITSRWTPVMGTQEYMDIGSTLKSSRFALRNRMEFWNRLQSKYSA